MPDPECAWQILLQSAGPRANHTIRTLPPSQSRECARAHDAGLWATLAKILQGPPGTEPELAVAKQLASLPLRSGGLGLRSAERNADAAYWASWADALHMIAQRNPDVADLIVSTFAKHPGPAEGCLAELHGAAARLDSEGFRDRPSWEDFRNGERPPEPVERDPDEWQHGWQYFASSCSDKTFRKTSLLSNRPAAARAHLRSHSGRNAGAALASVPTAKEFTIPPFLMRVLLLERLRLPLPLTEAT